LNPQAKISPGELLKRLRIRTGLTQAELGLLIPISEKMIRNWETDTNLPKAQNLKKLIEICLQLKVFIAGAEQEEALHLWNSVKAVFDATTRTYNEYPAFDQGWFENLTRLTSISQDPKESTPETKTNQTRLRDWGEAPGLETFYGREKELALLNKWLVEDSCRLVALLGMGGIGKTTLSVKLAQEVEDHFEVVIWRSLRNAPSVENILDDCLELLLARPKSALPQVLDSKISLLIDNLRKKRCLLVLDNAESILQTGSQSRVGHYRQGYEGYGELISRVGETGHSSCLIITAREKPREFNRLGGNKSPVRVMNLAGLTEGEAREILADKGLVNYSQSSYNALIERYSGNPLALKIVAEFILEIFHGQIGAFLKSSRMVFGDITDLMNEQFERLNDLEKQVMFWLAIEREPVPLEVLAADLLQAEPDKDLLEALSSLRRRSLLEVGELANVFTLQPVVMEYVTERFTEQVCVEIERQEFGILCSHAVMKAQAREYVRNNQIHFILKPILAKLMVHSKDPAAVQKQLCELVSLLREKRMSEQGYAGGNLVNLLYHLTHDLRGYDFSGLNIWQAYLQGIDLQGVNLRRSDLTSSVFTETFNVIWSVAFSPDGKFLAAGGINGEVRFWRLQDGQQVLTLAGHTDWVGSIAFSPDGKLFVSGSHDRTIKFWDIESGRCLRTIVAHDDMIWSIAISPDGKRLASAGKDHLVKIWEVSSGQCLGVLEGHTNWVNSVAFSPDGKLLASGSNDQSIKLWAVATNVCLRTIQTELDMFWSVAFSPDGSLVAGCGNRPAIGLWRVDNGKPLKELETEAQGSAVYSIAFSPDGKNLLSGSKDGTLCLYDLSREAPFKTWQGHNSLIRSVAFSPNGQLVASCGEEQTVKVWEVQSTLGECYRTLQGYSHRIGAVTFSPDGNLLASGGDEQVIRLWNTESIGPAKEVYRCEKMIPWQTSFILSLQFSPDSQWLVGGSYDWSVNLWKVGSEQRPRTLRGEGGMVWGVSFSPDSRLLASSDYTNTIKLWEVDSGECHRILEGHKHQIWSVVFSPDGKQLASTSDDQTVRLWDVASGECLAVLEGHKRLVWMVAFSPDGKHLASASDDWTVRLWDIETRSCLKILKGHKERLRSLTFSPDGRFLASGSYDRTVRLWDARSGEELAELVGHEEVVRGLAFHPNCQVLATGSEDGTIRLWQVFERKCFKVLRSKRPYEDMNISHITGLTLSQKESLKGLGAIEYSD
jgi:WD40 repeat protein/transcriptional regulator with XRE-family HTH domain